MDRLLLGGHAGGAFSGNNSFNGLVLSNYDARFLGGVQVGAEVSSNIVGVSTASAEAGAAAGEVLSASAALRREADVLRSEIDAFLSNIRAA